VQLKRFKQKIIAFLWLDNMMSINSRTLLCFIAYKEPSGLF